MIREEVKLIVIRVLMPNLSPPFLWFVAQRKSFQAKDPPPMVTDGSISRILISCITQARDEKEMDLLHANAMYRY